MIQQGQAYYRTAPWLVIVPGLAIMITVFAFNLLGDGLRDALDPMQSGDRDRYVALYSSPAGLVDPGLDRHLADHLCADLLPACRPGAHVCRAQRDGETVARIRHELGLDLPLWQQYVNYVGNIFQGDLGFSFRKQQPVLELILSRLPYTMALIVAGIFVELAIGLPVGVTSAVERGRWPDRFGMFIALLGVSVPAFWLGLMLLYWFAYQHSHLPAWQRGRAVEHRAACR